jgi:hypothetical protein
LLIQEGDESDAAYGQRVAEAAERIGRGEDFADLAAELSDDLGSASLGGELGFTDGSAFPDQMETAIAALANRVIFRGPSKLMRAPILFVSRNASPGIRSITPR